MILVSCYYYPLQVSHWGVQYMQKGEGLDIICKQTVAHSSVGYIHVSFEENHIQNLCDLKEIFALKVLADFYCQEKTPEAVAQRCSVKKVFLETLQNSQENACAKVCFFVFELVHILTNLLGIY